MMDYTLRRRVESSPSACLILAHRARLSSIKSGRPFSEALPFYLSKKSKLYSALEAAESRSIRAVLDLIEDEAEDFQRARNEEASDAEIRQFVTVVIKNAEALIPGFCAERAA